MQYFLEAVETGGVVLSAAGLVSFIVIHTFFCSLDSDKANPSGLSWFSRFNYHLQGIYDVTEIGNEKLNKKTKSSE